MRISLKYSELHPSDVQITCVSMWVIREYMAKYKDQIDTIRVTRCRKSSLPKDYNVQEIEHWKLQQSLNQHKVVIAFKPFLGLNIKMYSHRTDAAGVQSIGLQPDPTAASKEKTAQMMEKLDASNH